MLARLARPSRRRRLRLPDRRARPPQHAAPGQRYASRGCCWWSWPSVGPAGGGRGEPAAVRHRRWPVCSPAMGTRRAGCSTRDALMLGAVLVCRPHCSPACSSSAPCPGCSAASSNRAGSIRCTASSTRCSGSSSIGFEQLGSSTRCSATARRSCATCRPLGYQLGAGRADRLQLRDGGQARDAHAQRRRHRDDGLRRPVHHERRVLQHARSAWCPPSIGERNFLGNDIAYPAGGRTGDNCLLATKAMIPIAVPIRARASGCSARPASRSPARSTATTSSTISPAGRNGGAAWPPRTGTTPSRWACTWLVRYALRRRPRAGRLRPVRHREPAGLGGHSRLRSCSTSLFTLVYFVLVERAVTQVPPAPAAVLLDLPGYVLAPRALLEGAVDRLFPDLQRHAVQER